MKFIIVFLLAFYFVITIGHEIYLGELTLKGPEVYTMAEHPFVFWGFILFRVGLVISIFFIKDESS